jgi:O-antigen/teichoic acid export membrane protein
MNLYKLINKYQLTKHGIALMLVNLISTSLGFLSGTIIAAILGPYARGVYQAWRIFGAIFSDIANFGLSKFIASKFNIESTSFKGIFRHITLVYLFVSALIPLMLYLNFSITLIFLFYMLIPIGIFSDIYIGLLTRHGKYRIIAFWNLFAWAGGAMATILLFLIDMLTLESAIIANSSMAALAIFFGKKNIDFPNGTTSIYSLYRRILPIYFSNVFRVVFLFLDQILVMLFLNLENLGIYSMALAVAGITTIATSSLNSIAPSIAKQKRLKKMKSLIQLFVIYSIIAILAVFFCRYFLPNIVAKTIGDVFYPIISIVPIMIIGNLLQSFVQFQISWSIYENDNKILIIEKCVHTVGLVLSGLIFYHLRTIQAAAWMSILVYVPTFLFFAILNLKDLRKVKHK